MLCAQNQNNLTQLTDEVLSLSEYQLINLYNQVRLTPERLPYTINKKGELVTVSPKNWTSGFFPGSLWYLYEYSGKKETKEAAIEMTERIREQQYMTYNHDVGFMINCSFGNALRLTGNKDFERVIVTAANSLSTRFNKKLGVIKSWDNNNWQYPVIIDNMMNLELLTQATKISGDSSFFKIAVSHADTTMKYHFRKDGSSFHLVSYDTINGGYIERVTHQGAYDESSWSRGQAWGLYGYVMMYRETKKQEYLEQAIKIANFISNHKNLPKDKIPFWDFDAPDIPNALRDASAGAIIASALIELSTFTFHNLSEKYLSLGEQMLRSLSSPAYLAQKDKNGYFILNHSIAFMAKKREVDAPLNYADYYFLEALLRIRKIKAEKSL